MTMSIPRTFRRNHTHRTGTVCFDKDVRVYKLWNGGRGFVEEVVEFANIRNDIVLDANAKDPAVVARRASC